MGKNRKTKRLSTHLTLTHRLSEGQTHGQVQQQQQQQQQQLLQQQELKSTEKYPSFNSDSNQVKGPTNQDPVVCNIDHSVAREQIDLGVKNVRQILMCLEEGTDEVKNLVMNECEIIYECKICFSLFRSLANFIAHKRVYCKELNCQRVNKFDTATVHVEEAQPVKEDEEVKNEFEGKKKRKYIEECAAWLTQERIKEKQAKSMDLSLTPIRSNPNAMFQKLTSTSTITSSTTTISSATTSSIPKMVNGHAEVNGHEVKRLKVDEKPEINKNEVCELKCKLCNSEFKSMKTLKVHMQTQHTDCPTVYTCLFCPLSFKQLSNATRHLIQIHKKTKTQANALKQIIKKRCENVFCANKTSSTKQSNEDKTNESATATTAQAARSTSTSAPTPTSASASASTRTLISSALTSPALVSVAKTNGFNSIKIPSNPSRIDSFCAFNCGAHFTWLPAKSSHEKRCKKRRNYIRNRSSAASNCSKTNQTKLTNSPAPKTPVHGSSQAAVQHSNSVVSCASGSGPSRPVHGSTVPNSVPASSTPNFVGAKPPVIVIPKQVEEEMNTFMDKRSLKCSRCPTLKLPHLSQLIVHSVTHLGYHVYKCQLCPGHHAVREIDVKKHLQRIHQLTDEQTDNNKHMNYCKIIASPMKSPPSPTYQNNNNSNSSNHSNSSNDLPAKARKSINGPNYEQGSKIPTQEKEPNSKLKLHLKQDHNNSNKKCYKIVDK